MVKQRKIKAKASTWDKVKKIDEEFAVAVNSATTEQLRDWIINTNKSDEEYKELQDNDGDLKSLKEAVKAASSLYTDTFTANKLKRKLCLELLAERGIVVKK
jgi:hypothetical protein